MTWLGMGRKMGRSNEEPESRSIGDYSSTTSDRRFRVYISMTIALDEFSRQQKLAMNDTERSRNREGGQRLTTLAVL